MLQLKEKAPSKKPTSVTAETEFEPDYWVYTDGACINNGSPRAKAGMGIYFGPHDPRNVSKVVEGKQSNNTAELGAINHLYTIIEDDIKAGKKVAVASDSSYAIRCVTSYGQACADAGWKKEIPNKELVKQTYELYSGLENVRFFHVKAHTDKTDPHSVGNDAADRLANLAVGVESCPYAAAATVAKPVFLNVSFARKEEIKALGGRWNAEAKKWYISSTASNITTVLEKFDKA